MRHPKEELERWLKQAGHDLKVAKTNFGHEFFADVCYSAEQAAQKALKGYLYFRGSTMVWKHSVKELVEEGAELESRFSELIDAGKILTMNNIFSRAAKPKAAVIRYIGQSIGSLALFVLYKTANTARYFSISSALAHNTSWPSYELTLFWINF